MKLKNILFLAIAAASVAGCTDDLDVQPLNPNVITGESAYSTPEGYLKGLMKIYSVWALHSQESKNGNCDISGVDGGNSQLLRSLFNLQELTTDEAKCIWPNEWNGALNQLSWTNEKNEAEEGVYQFSMYIVTLVNEYMKNISGAPDDIRTQYAAEARFNRALAYYFLMDTFGFPPFITENNYSLTPSQLSRAELFDFIEQELLEIRDDLPAALAGEYGRADRGAVDALLARMYLNATVYTGSERYTDCIAACNRVISSGYSLAGNYRNLFRADNGQNADTRKEIIFPICFDGTKTTTWGGCSYIILASRPVDHSHPEDGFTVSGWGGLIGTPNLIGKFEFADPENPTCHNVIDCRGIFDSDGHPTTDITDLAGLFNEQSWAVYKYCNTTSTGAMGPNSLNGEDVDTDFPMFRLADIYLMYAEAVARGGQGGDLGKAVDYVNQLRRRGYNDSKHDINAAWLSANNYRNILDERCRELYWEAVRRTDLVRYGLLTSSEYVWPFKGGVKEGVGVDSKYNLFAIPTSDISVNPNLKQNEGF